MKKIIIFSIILLVVFFIFRENRSCPQVSQNGIATNQLADDLMAKYDMDADGKLNVSTESFKRIEIEKIKKMKVIHNLNSP